jgi:hypothetical protein
MQFVRDSAAWDSTLAVAGWGILLTWSGDTGTIAVDSSLTFPHAGDAQTLQGQDTTALWNAKTLQGKDTTALFAAKTAAKIATDGDSAKVWGMTSPSTQGWMTGGSATTNADSLGHVAAAGYVTKSDSVLLTASSGRVSWDLANGGSAFLTMPSACTLNLPTNITPGRIVTLTLIQDSTGSRPAVWASGWKFCGDTATTGYATAAPTLTATGFPTYAGDVFTWLCARGYMIFLGFSPAVLP